MMRRLVKLILLLLILGAAIALTATNPSDADMQKRTASDGWLNSERANYLLFKISNVSGITGAKGTYLGIGGAIFKIKG